MFCALSVISLSWKTLVFGRFTSQERTNVHRTAFFLHTPDFSSSKVTALKVVWGKDTSRRSKGPGSDLPSCFPAWAPFCKCGWRHHISKSGCGPDCICFYDMKARPRPLPDGGCTLTFAGIIFLCIRIFLAFHAGVFRGGTKYELP